jgi:hypothetical protein
MFECDKEAAECPNKGCYRYADSSLHEELVVDFIEIDTMLLSKKALDELDVHLVEDARLTSLPCIRIVSHTVVAMVGESPIDETLADAEHLTDGVDRKAQLESKDWNASLEIA